MESYRRIAVIMAGGSGERFWPLSREGRPKQLLKLVNPDKRLIEEAVDRVRPVVKPEDIVIATSPALLQATQDALPDLRTDQFLAEPAKRNTSGGLVWVTANLLATKRPEEKLTMCMIASDHRIDPPEKFAECLGKAFDHAEQSGGLCTIGIPPTRPETGYGYLEIEVEDGEGEGRPAQPVQRFHEKPSREKALEYVSCGRFLWNSGIFIWTLDAFLEELRVHAPALEQAVQDIALCLKNGHDDDAKAIFDRLDDVSIDYALMERSKKVHYVKADFDWDDVGSWDALERFLPKDEADNVLRGDASFTDAARNIVVNEHQGLRVDLLGVHDLIVVVTDSSVLVCPKHMAQEVRRVARKAADHATSPSGS